ncbi:MAG: exo-alpha-sialidase [Chloroflexi bacterium]|nr:MAG: exo-alpha-sialidase [Chloroflexota bacterium]
MRRMSILPVMVALAGLIAGSMGARAGSPDTLVTVGSPTGPFAQNKQNEPALAVDASHPNVLAAGANEEVDMEACNAGTDNSCPFTPGVGVSGIYFSFDSGASWTQPTYTGWSARNCTGTVGDSDAACSPQAGGPIGTLPWYFENGLISDGDPALSFGPRPGPNGFSWSNGSRLYYANLTANFSSTFKGFEAIAVSRTDDVAAAAASDKSAWSTPVIISKQSQTTFSDKEQIWADNATSSPFFGYVYVCWASFVGQEKGNAAPAPLQVGTSKDGGQTWTVRPLSSAANNSQRNPADGCTVRTDSHGAAYVFGVGTDQSQGHQSFELLSKSTDGGSTWSTPRPVVGPVNQPGIFDPVQGRPEIDGITGARSDLAPAPSVDIANGAPTGTDATDRIVMTYVSGPIATPRVYFSESSDGGATWAASRAIETGGDRGFYTAPSISPDGSDVYVVYNAFTTPYRTNTTDPRLLVGVVLHADSGSSGTGAFSELHRGLPGDARGSSANALVAEFLGDYVYAVATRDYGAAVWNDARNAADCPAVDAWRISLEPGNTALTKPAPEQDCPSLSFGNSDIFGGAFADPTP